jgi:hypothetical protein
VVDGVGHIRQRIKSIAPGVAERLNPFVIRLSKFPDADEGIVLSIHAVDDSGNKATRTFPLRLVVGDTKEISFAALLGNR